MLLFNAPNLNMLWGTWSSLSKVIRFALWCQIESDFISKNVPKTSEQNKQYPQWESEGTGNLEVQIVPPTEVQDCKRENKSTSKFVFGPRRSSKIIYTKEFNLSRTISLPLLHNWFMSSYLTASMKKAWHYKGECRHMCTWFTVCSLIEKCMRIVVLNPKLPYYF